MKLKFSDFSSTTVERVGQQPSSLTIVSYSSRDGSGEMPVRLIGIGVRLQDGWEHASRRLPFEKARLNRTKMCDCTRLTPIGPD